MIYFFNMCHYHDVWNIVIHLYSFYLKSDVVTIWFRLASVLYLYLSCGCAKTFYWSTINATATLPCCTIHIMMYTTGSSLLYFRGFVPVNFTHIIQGYFAGTGAIIIFSSMPMKQTWRMWVNMNFKICTCQLGKKHWWCTSQIHIRDNSYYRLQ